MRGSRRSLQGWRGGSQLTEAAGALGSSAEPVAVRPTTTISTTRAASARRASGGPVPLLPSASRRAQRVLPTVQGGGSAAAWPGVFRFQHWASPACLPGGDSCAPGLAGLGGDPGRQASPVARARRARARLARRGLRRIGGAAGVTTGAHRVTSSAKRAGRLPARRSGRRGRASIGATTRVRSSSSGRFVSLSAGVSQRG